MRGDAVRIVLRAWIWSDSLFRHKISDVAIVSQAVAILPANAFGLVVHPFHPLHPTSGPVLSDANASATATDRPRLSISTNFVFEGIKVLIIRQLPIWPIILGALLGLALLACIVVGMWRCGFFRRKRWYTSQPGSGPVLAGAGGAGPTSTPGPGPGPASNPGQGAGSSHVVATRNGLGREPNRGEMQTRSSMDSNIGMGMNMGPKPLYYGGQQQYPSQRDLPTPYHHGLSSYGHPVTMDPPTTLDPGYYMAGTPINMRHYGTTEGPTML
ncbi:unnamed protein product [Protopolystoma xenopodis]|uniref:Integrin alpha-2 domain-containing protein n=1 Tax=Protopolystoma xenopodis TaxID=117903 RepID=A0A3S5A7Z8_9PLAT|nr:unnamed protein product [Protopolystoma xenopodis]